MNPFHVVFTALLASLPAGEPRPTKLVDVVNLVEGRTAILSILPGSSVKKGDVVAELDSAPLRDALANQEIIVRGAEAEFRNAKTAREVAENAASGASIALDRDVDKARNRVKLAESAATKAENYLAAVKKAKWDHKLRAAEIARLKTGVALDDARLALKTLQDVTIPQRTREGEILLNRSRGEENSKAETLALHQAKEAKLRLQIEHCKLIAPADGRLSYANPSEPSSKTPWIEEGAIVRERQVVLRITPTGS